MQNEMQCGCVAPDTKIAMADGMEKMIKDIRIGDIVFGRGLQFMRVMNTWIGPESDAMIQMTAQDMESPLLVTKTHTIWVQEPDGTTKWKNAGECKVSDKVLCIFRYEEKYCSILRIEEREPCNRVYNLDLVPLRGEVGKQAGTMYCNGILTGDMQIQYGKREE